MVSTSCKFSGNKDMAQIYKKLNTLFLDIIIIITVTNL